MSLYWMLTYLAFLLVRSSQALVEEDIVTETQVCFINNGLLGVLLLSYYVTEIVSFC